MAKILIADDDPFLIKIYSTRFTQDGHQVISCTDGKTALNQAIEFLPDLIILDIMLPQLNGLDVLSEIKSNKQLSQTPVIILSNLTHAEEQKEAQKRGADKFLAKVQYTPSQVISEIAQYLPKSNKKSNKK